MRRSFEHYHRDVLSGAERGARATVFRAGLSIIEPFYSAVILARNAAYDRGILPSRRVARPVISVGNITTGGTGKTPVVRWLAQRLVDTGRHPAILLRGYKGGDEQRMLQAQLPTTIVEANPSRVDGAARVIDGNPQVDVFVLDDGFQHRRIHRDFELVLINAGNPFGFGHVLPRGLLRETLAGLSRAHAFLITHAQPDAGATESTLRRHNPEAPIYCCRHAHTGLRDRHGRLIPLTQLAGLNVMTFCGIGNPKNFYDQIGAAGARLVGNHWFGDHHHYTTGDLEMLRSAAGTAGAQALVTTEKDWVKIEKLMSRNDEAPNILRVEMAVQFLENDESRLLDQILNAIKTPDPRAPRGGDRSPADSRS